MAAVDAAATAGPNEQPEEGCADDSPYTTFSLERRALVKRATKQDLEQIAVTLPVTYGLVNYRNNLYIPEHWKTGSSTPLPTPEETVWKPLPTDRLQALVNDVLGIRFGLKTELDSFEFEVLQEAVKENGAPTRILVRTKDGLKTLTDVGTLEDPDGLFLPNYIRPQLNEDPAVKAEVFETIAHWVDGEDDAHSLLNHLATSLAPGWSAVKYMLLLGDGRNGKSLLASMLADLFGEENISNVTRQQMGATATPCLQLNGKLLNVVFDGAMDYIKNSGPEKTFIAGEPVGVRPLFHNRNVLVQTNALFIECLNSEPKTRDKSDALQRRLVRFWFPHRFELNKAFERHMRSQKMLGAFLAVLLDHYVQPHELQEKLALTERSLQLQNSQMHLNSVMLQFIEYELSNSPTGMVDWTSLEVDDLLGRLESWSLRNTSDVYSRAERLRMLGECFVLDRKSVRVGAIVKKVPVVKSIKPVLAQYLEHYVAVERGVMDELDEAAVVAD